MIRALVGHLRARAGYERSVLDPGTAVGRKPNRPRWREKAHAGNSLRRFGRAFLPVGHSGFPAPVFTDLTAVLFRSSQAHRVIRRQISQRSGSPAGGLRARPDGSVVGPRCTTSPTARAGRDRDGRHLRGAIARIGRLRRLADGIATSWK